MIRILLVAMTTAAGVIAGRKAINNTVASRIPKEVEAAQAMASAELNKRINELVRERLAAFGLTLLVKIGLVSAVYLLFSYGHLTATGLRIAGFSLIGAFIVRDLVKSVPFILPALKFIRQHDWSFRRALTELVAGIVFERAYAAALLATETGPNRFWIGFSNYSAHSISQEVAEAVTQVARQTSYKRIRSRAILGGATAAVMMGVYTFFLTVMLTAG